MPEWKAEILRRLAPLKLAPTREAEIAEELAQHLDDRYQELTANGQSEDAAFRSALDELKGEELLARRLRPVERSDYREPIAPGRSTGNFFSGVLQDIRYALRMLRKSPGFTAVAILTLALGIGANTAIFSVVNTVLIKPLPYPHPEQLVSMWRTHGTWTGSISVPDFNDWQAQSTDFQGMSLYTAVRFNLHGTNEPQAVEAARVSPNFFDMMQKPLYLGRGFATGEDQAGANHVVVLSYELWENEFGGDRRLIGKAVQLSGASYTVVGVAAPNFHFPHPVTALWVPLTPLKEQMTRGSHDFVGIARVKPGISVPQARGQLNAISARLAKTYPDTDAQLGALLIPLKDATVGGIRSSLLIVFAVMGFVFLIACANVSSYVLSRAEARRRELAIRAALGAGRGRLIRQFFAEGLVLALCGALLAALTGRWSVQAIIALASLYFSDPGRIRPDATVFAFTLGLAAVAAVLLSMGVAWNASRVNVHETLKEGAQTASGGRRTLVMQKILIVLQLSIACLLLVTADGMIESLARLSRLNPGFDPHHVLVMRVPLPPQSNSPAHPAWLFFGPALERINALPGVKSAAVITYLPMQSWGTNSRFQVQGRAKVAQSEAPWSEVRAISPDYFRVMGIHLLQGRWLNAGDTASSENVLVVNRAFVRKYFPKENILGQRIDFTDEGHWQTIVGVVDDSHQTGLDTEVLPEADEPCTQANWAYLTQTMSLAVRTKGDPLLLAKSVQQAIYSQDPSQAVYGVKTMDDVVAETEADQRFVLWLLGLFAALAVVLSCTGLFGQVSYAVGQRTHEIGVRMALGAQRGRIAKMILRQGGSLVAAGLAAGVAASFGLTKVMASLLYGVKPAGLIATLASIALLAAVGLFACYIPARRAMKVDPMTALRYE